MIIFHLLDRINCFSVGRSIVTCTFIIVKAQGSETQLNVICCRFLQTAVKKTKELDDGIKEIHELTKQLAQYFCEDEGKLKLQELLSLFKTFSDQLVTAKKVR